MSASMAIPHLDAGDLARLVPAGEAVGALECALRDGLDPEAGVPRSVVPVANGEVLVMPSETDRFVGVKVATVAPGNPGRGLPKIQGRYLLFDAATLALVATMDGAALTLIRTPAVTALAVLHLLRARADAGAGAAASAGARSDTRLRIGRLAVLGTGVQARQHTLTIARTACVDEVVLFGRRGPAVAQLADQLSHDGVRARPGARHELPAADVVICATSSDTPVLLDQDVGDNAVIGAIGAHGLGAREVDPALVRRSDIVVESRTSALAESGDLIPARSVDEWRAAGLANLRDLVIGGFLRRERSPALFTGVGMAWQDLVIASHALDSARDQESR